MGQRFVAAAALTAGALLSAQPIFCAQPGTRSLSELLTDPHPAVSGVVRDATGAPQVGALVELLGPNLGVVARTFTDDRGRYALPRVAPGTYEVKASGSYFVPTLRENLRLLASSRLVVNLTLNTLYQAFQWLPAQPRAADEPKDDWNWTLRLSTNRPLLRVLDDDGGGGSGTDSGPGSGPVVLVTDGAGGNTPSRLVTVRSGSNRFGEGGMHQDLAIERGHDDAHQLILRTDLGRTDVGQTDGATLRTTAAYLRRLTPGSSFISVASFSAQPDVASSRDSGLQMMTLRSAMTTMLGPGLEAEVGNELQAIHLGQTLTATHPFAGLTMHAGDTTVRYRIASSAGAEQAAELDRDDTLSPRISERDGVLRFEQGLHQSFDVQHTFEHWTTGMTYFHDSVAHPLVGGGVAIVAGRPALTAADAAGGDLLYDQASQLIEVSGQSYTGDGILAIARDQITPEAWISLRYAIGQALSLESRGTDSRGIAPTGIESTRQPAPSLSAAVESLRAHPTPMLAVSVGGGARHSDSEDRPGTEWRASYRWQPSDTLTQVAPFDSTAPEAYLSFHLRQPITLRGAGRTAGLRGMQAIVDVRNLLAQGYRPFLSQDGSTLYFAQAERCIEAGLSFAF